MIDLVLDSIGGWTSWIVRRVSPDGTVRVSGAGIEALPFIGGLPPDGWQAALGDVLALPGVRSALRHALQLERGAAVPAPSGAPRLRSDRSVVVEWGPA